MSDNAPSLHYEKELIPRALIRACVFLVLSLTALVGLAVILEMPKGGVPEASPIAAERMISVEIKPRGAALIFDETGALVHEFAEGEAGFMDSVFRALRYQRQKSGVAAEGPVTIARLENDRHVMIDPNSGWRLSLLGYGANNIEPFVELLAAK